MTANDARNWLGKYFLLTTAGIGGYMLLFGGTPLLPIPREDAVASFEILIPVMAAQLAIIFRYYGSSSTLRKTPLDVPVWTVKLPALVFLGLFFLTCGTVVLGNALNLPWTPGAATFRAVVAFCGALLTSTTVLIVSRFFGRSNLQRDGSVKRDTSDLGVNAEQ